MVQSGLGPHYVYVEDARHVTQHNLIGDVYGLLHVTSKFTVVKCVCHQSSLCVWAWESVECGPEAYEGKMSELIPLKCSALSLSTPLCCNFISGNPPGMFSLVCLIWPRGQARQTLCLGLGPLFLSLSLSQFIIPPPLKFTTHRPHWVSTGSVHVYPLYSLQVLLLQVPTLHLPLCFFFS